MCCFDVLTGNLDVLCINILTCKVLLNMKVMLAQWTNTVVDQRFP